MLSPLALVLLSLAGLALSGYAVVELTRPRGNP